jgi:hypothetical protein
MVLAIGGRRNVLVRGSSVLGYRHCICPPGHGVHGHPPWQSALSHGGEEVSAREPALKSKLKGTSRFPFSFVRVFQRALSDEMVVFWNSNFHNSHPLVRWRGRRLSPRLVVCHPATQMPRTAPARRGNIMGA